ncbi:MAG: hypothetical protein ACFFDT_18405 [Candidatus Hodarchaeota archaeon]
MIIERKKFPFKLMPPIIKSLENHEFLTSFQLSRKIGTCFADASEVTRMLYYLTSSGKVVTNSKMEWKIIPCPEDLPQLTKFRTKYIQDLITLIQNLDGSFKSVNDLVDDTDWSQDDVQEALIFLSLVTKKGYLFFEGDGHRQKWLLKKWPN